MNDKNLLPEEEQNQTEFPQEEVVDETPSTQETGEGNPPSSEPETDELSPEDALIPKENPEDAMQPEEETASQLSEQEAMDARSEIMKRKPYHERQYLKYCNSDRCASLDLAGTKELLKTIGFDGGELRQAREGKRNAEVFRNFDQNKKNQMYCSYCGSEISGVEYYRLPDGRLRCTTCSRSIVTDKEEIQALCKRVIAHMDNFFGADIEVPVSIEVLDERKLKKKTGVPLDTGDDQSMLILGVAINKKEKYSILLENGAPRLSLIATFAHELTHIWQYTHWDANKKMKKCSKDKRLLIYEGMAKWAEIQYLYLIGETAVARREEIITRNREDEYGIGFRLYEDYYPLSRETMTCGETPFTKDKYPFE